MLRWGIWAGIAPVPEGVWSRFARANSYRLLQCANEYLAVSDVSGFGRFFDGIDGVLYLVVAQGDSILTLGRKSMTYSAPR